MRDKVLLTFITMNLVFLASGIVLLVFALTSQSSINSTPTLDSVARDVVLKEIPRTATIGNAVFVFITFLLFIPAIAMPMTQGWLKVHGYMTMICAVFSLVLGLVVWFKTLTTRSRMGVIWTALPSSTQSLLQQDLHCCGYQNSTSPLFVTDSQCLTDIAAVSQLGCVGPLSTFANNFLDLIFTAAFGMAGFDIALLLVTTMLSKDREEKERYRHIDEKNGVRAI